MKKYLLSLVLIVILIARHAPRVFAEDDFQYWQRIQAKVLDTKYVDFITYGELRFTGDAGNFGYWQTTQKLQWDRIPYVQFGLGYTYLEQEVINSRREEEFKHQHRLELEFSPYYDFTEWLKLKTRNRFEFRWIEDQGSDHARYRHLDEIEIAVKQMKPLQSLYMNNEFFVDFNRRDIIEDRVTPIGLTFQLYKKSTLKIFYVIQCRKGARGDWSSNQVLGSQIGLVF